ncbi:MAG: hypothetical protein WBV82_01335 [Myxococcaceae bacterium]
MNRTRHEALLELDRRHVWHPFTQMQIGSDDAPVPSVELAARLVSIAPPGLTRVFYSDSGSTSVEIAATMIARRRGNTPGPSGWATGSAWRCAGAGSFCDRWGTWWC